MRSLKINEHQAGKRLDVFAAEQMPDLSRAFIQRLCAEGKILVNSIIEKPGYRLKLKDQIKIDFNMEEIEKIAEIELPIVFEDKDVLVINKPTGVISHARGRYWNEPSVASFVRQKTGQKGDRAGIVHRLDRATSGVMICAKNQAALSYLQKQFSARKVHKTYVAVISGEINPPSAIIDMPIERNPKRPQVFRVGSNGKPAQTQYTTLKVGKKYSLVELKPRTGRTHQLRVHLKYLKHPILGDELYGGETADRLYLHAESIEMSLPSGEKKVFKVASPKEFKAII